MPHSYPSDIDREQFNKIKPILESARKKTRPKTVDLYDVICGISYQKILNRFLACAQ